MTATSARPRAVIIALALVTVTFIVSGAFLGEVFGSSGDSDQTFVAHYASSRNRGGDIAGAALLIVAGAAFLVFVAAMRRMLEPVESLAVDLFSQTGLAVAVLLTLAGSLFITTPFSIAFGGVFDDTGQFAGGHAAVLPQAATFIMAFAAMPMAAFVIVLLTIANRKRMLFPRWHAVLGWVCSALLLLAISGVAGLALPVWTAATAIALWRRGDVGLGLDAARLAE